MTKRSEKNRRTTGLMPRSWGRVHFTDLAELGLEHRIVPADFSNTAPIVIPSFGAATVSQINVSVPAGQQITNLQVLFNQLSHESPDNIDAMVIAPDGTHIYLMSDTGGNSSQAISLVNPTFADTGPSLTDGQITSGVYRPTNLDQGDPDTIPGAPATPPVTTLSAFKGLNPNGIWELRINDDTALD